MIGESMKNRKGFTLVELLAVIAILAILVIIALPNVLNMYKKANLNHGTQGGGCFIQCKLKLKAFMPETNLPLIK